MKDIALFTLILGVVIGAFIYSLPSRDDETISKLRYESCVTEMQKAIPDANDTEGRAQFLKNCHD
jgi:hypothetical protein